MLSLRTPHLCLASNEMLQHTAAIKDFSGSPRLRFRRTRPTPTVKTALLENLDDDPFIPPRLLSHLLSPFIISV